MKIHQRNFPGMRHHITRFGKLVIRQGSEPQFFPNVLGGMVGKTVSRQEAAQCLRIWRNLPA